jgi:hypothetical protein
MSFRANWTPGAKATFEELEAAARAAGEARQKKGKKRSSQAEGLFKQVAQCIQNLLADPRHPGLNTHEYRSLEHPFDPKAKVFEAYAQNRTPGAYRVFWCYGPAKDTITIIAITPHP